MSFFPGSAESITCMRDKLYAASQKGIAVLEVASNALNLPHIPDLKTIVL